MSNTVFLIVGIRCRLVCACIYIYIYIYIYIQDVCLNIYYMMCTNLSKLSVCR